MMRSAWFARFGVLAVFLGLLLFSPAVSAAVDPGSGWDWDYYMNNVVQSPVGTRAYGVFDDDVANGINMSVTTPQSQNNLSYTLNDIPASGSLAWNSGASRYQQSGGNDWLQLFSIGGRTYVRGLLRGHYTEGAELTDSVLSPDGASSPGGEVTVACDTANNRLTLSGDGIDALDGDWTGWFTYSSSTGQHTNSAGNSVRIVPWGDGDILFCGGTLLGAEWVLTDA